jgi:hypothetical protein
MNRKHSETSLLKKEDIEVLKHEKPEDTGPIELARGKLTLPSPGTQKACLRVIKGPAKNRIIYLAEPAALIGRDPDCEIQLLDHTVSRRHARVVFQNEEFILEDLDSTNGTYVNGIRIVRCILRQNDAIHIGNVKMIFTEEVLLPES